MSNALSSGYTFITTSLIAFVRVVYKPKMHHWLTFALDLAGLISTRAIFCKTKKTKAIFFLFPESTALKVDLSLNMLNYIMFFFKGYEDLMKANTYCFHFIFGNLPLELLFKAMIFFVTFINC